MKFYIDIDGISHSLELPPPGSPEKPTIDGNKVDLGGIESSSSLIALHLNNRPFTIDLQPDGERYQVQVNGEHIELTIRDERAESIRRLVGAKTARHDLIGEIKAPMPGLVVKLLADEGDEVKKGQGVIVVEAMKMENVITAPINGRIKRICIAAGKAVNKGELMLVIS